MVSLTGQCDNLRAKLNEAVHNLEAMQLESKANRYMHVYMCMNLTMGLLSIIFLSVKWSFYLYVIAILEYLIHSILLLYWNTVI